MLLRKCLKRPMVILASAYAVIIGLMSALSGYQQIIALISLVILSSISQIALYKKYHRYSLFIPLILGVAALVHFNTQHQHHPLSTSKSRIVVEDLDQRETYYKLQFHWWPNGVKETSFAYLYSSPAHLYYGDSLDVLIKSIPFYKATEFDGFNAKLFYEPKHIFYRSIIDTIYKIKACNTFSLYSLAQKAQNYCSRIYTACFPKQEDAALMNGIILGSREQLPARINELFIKTGTAHILAVSGLHVGMLYAILQFIFSLLPPGWIKTKKILKPITIITAVWSFSMITGLGASIVRAAVMFSLLELGLQVKKYTDTTNILFGTSFLMMLANPCIIFDIGFQLSFMAVLSIVWFLPYIRKLYASSNYRINLMLEIIWVTLAVQFFVFPITIFYFQQFPVYFLIANMIWIPLSFALMVLGICVLLIGSLSIALGSLVAYCCSLLISLGISCFELLEQLPGFIADGIWFSIPQLILILGSIISIYCWMKIQQSIYLYSTLSLATGILLSFPIQQMIQRNQKELVIFNTKNENTAGLKYGNTLEIYSPDSIITIKKYIDSRNINQIIHLDQPNKLDSILSDHNVVWIKSMEDFKLLNHTSILNQLLILSNRLTTKEKTLIKSQLTANQKFHELKTDGSYIFTF